MGALRIGTENGEYPQQHGVLEMQHEKPLPVIPPGTVGSLSSEEATRQATAVLDAFNAALASRDAKALAECFYPEQSYWKDQLALTWHLRTIENASTIASSFLETSALRNIKSGLAIQGPAQLAAPLPDLPIIGCGLSFTTSSPSSSSCGFLRLLPSTSTADNGDVTVSWKIWVLSTWIEALDLHPEDETKLQTPRRDLADVSQFDTEVFIIGGGNAAVTLAARLKAMGVESVMAERNANVGDNWALRYDSLCFHIPTSYAELPYMTYDKSLHTPHMLSKDELAAQVRKYVSAFNLNVITSCKIITTSRDEERGVWNITFETPTGIKSATSKHLVQATGFGSQIPYTPTIPDADLYKGKVLHSAHYKNANILRDQGVKSVIIVGSANTAFDIVEDCHAAGLQTTINARSPTYVVPVEYIFSAGSMGLYDAAGVAAADVLLMSGPTAVGASLAQAGFARLAAAEPDRYAPLAAAGFDVFDARDPRGSLVDHLLGRVGGHYVDIGATRLLAERRVAVRARAEPAAFTPAGLRFSDGVVVDADAVIWCTGFRDKNARTTAAEILGGEGGAQDGGSAAAPQEGRVLGPADIAARLDATWGIDSEGEVRGLWKRQLRIDNYWLMGGFTQQHRWYSRMLALQIKAELEGILPPAYRDTPGVQAT